MSDSNNSPYRPVVIILITLIFGLMGLMFLSSYTADEERRLEIESLASAINSNHAACVFNGGSACDEVRFQCKKLRVLDEVAWANSRGCE